jgi:hypothetical protein
VSLVIALQSALPDSPARLERTVAALGLTRWMYFGDDSAWRARAERGPLAGLERIPTGEALQEAAWELRRPYIDWVGSLAERNASVEWWACEVAAKTSYTMLYNRVCSLAAARALLRQPPEEPTLVVCSTRALAEGVHAFAPESRLVDPARGTRARARRAVRLGLRAWGRLAPGPVRRLPELLSKRARMSLDWNPSYRRRVLAEAGAARPESFTGDDAVLLFTWVDERSFAPDGSYRDPHFGLLPDLLRERGYRVAYLARVLPGTSFERAATELLRTQETIFFPDLYLDADDWRDCIRRAREFEPSIPHESSVAGVPVASLAHEHVDINRWTHSLNLSYDLLIRNLAAQGARPSWIAHTYEGHAWELALTWAVRAHLPETRVLGYENANMSRLALSMYPAESEYGLRPLPDRIVTNGPAFRRVLTSEGVPESLTRTGCALRHAYLWRMPEPQSSAPGEKLSVLVATDAAFGQAVELADKALLAFGGDSRYEVVVKFHPLLVEDEARSALGELAYASNARFSRQPMADLLATADMLLYTYTIVCYEALAHGVPPVFVRAETVVDLDQLEPYTDLRWEARTPKELRRVAAEIAGLDAERRAEWRRRARAAAMEALAPVDAKCIDRFLDLGPSN